MPSGARRAWSAPSGQYGSSSEQTSRAPPASAGSGPGRRPRSPASRRSPTAAPRAAGGPPARRLRPRGGATAGTPSEWQMTTSRRPAGRPARPRARRATAWSDGRSASAGRARRRARRRPAAGPPARSASGRARSPRDRAGSGSFAPPSDRYRNPRGVRTLDVTGLTCPMTWVRTKLELERMAPGDALEVRCRRGEALENVPRSAATRATSAGRRRARADRAPMSDRRAFLGARAPRARESRPADTAAPGRAPPRPDRGSTATRASSCSRVERGRPARAGDASVLVVGAGALGSPVATYLAGAGSGGSGSSTTATSSSPTSTASTCTSRPTSASRRRTARRPSSAS